MYNLPFNKRDNFLIFKHLIDDYLHDYIECMVINQVDIDIIMTYVKGFREPLQATNMIKALGMNPDIRKQIIQYMDQNKNDAGMNEDEEVPE